MAEHPSPYTLHLNAIVERARRDIRTWRDALVDAVDGLLSSGQKFPISDPTRTELSKLVASSEHDLRFRFSGTLEDPTLAKKLVEAGTLPASQQLDNPIVWAYKLGAARDTDTYSEPQTLPEDPKALEALAKEAIDIARNTRLSPVQEAAMRVAQQRGGCYITKPVSGMVESTVAQLETRYTQAELLPVKNVTTEALQKKWSAGTFKQELHAQLSSPAFQNNLDRIARTEPLIAHGQAALASLVERASAAGQKDPLVFVLASPGACDNCKRVWGELPNVARYRVSELLSNATNFGRPAHEWRAVPGPIHPQCTCPPPILYRPKSMEALVKADQLFQEKFGTLPKRT